MLDNVFKTPFLKSQMKTKSAGCLDEKYLKATSSYNKSSAMPLEFLLGSTIGDETKENLESFDLETKEVKMDFKTPSQSDFSLQKQTPLEGPLDSCNSSFYNGALSGRSTSIGKFGEFIIHIN